MYEDVLQFALTMWRKSVPNNYETKYLDEEMMPFARDLLHQIQGWRDPESFT